MASWVTHLAGLVPGVVVGLNLGRPLMFVMCLGQPMVLGMYG